MGTAPPRLSAGPRRRLTRSSPPRPAALESNPSGLEKADGGRAAWNLAIFDRNELGAAEGGGLSLILRSRPSPQSSRVPPHTSRMQSRCLIPSPVPCLHPSISALSLLLPAFSLPREQAPLGVALSCTLSKADSRQGPADAVTCAGFPLPYQAQPSHAHASLPSAHRGPSAQILESLHNLFLISVPLPLISEGLCFRELKAQASRQGPL
nr:uncharacterized protein LOC123280599 [Equus asinus]